MLRSLVDYNETTESKHKHYHINSIYESNVWIVVDIRGKHWGSHHTIMDYLIISQIFFHKLDV